MWGGGGRCEVVQVRLPEDVGKDDGGGTGFAHCTAGKMFCQLQCDLRFCRACIDRWQARKMVQGISWQRAGRLNN